MAERVGFEPTWGAMPPADFESEPFDRFGTSPDGFARIAYAPLSIEQLWQDA
jgi:hypothetical protein